MQDILAVTVGQTFDDLLEEALGDILLEPPTATDVVQEVSTGANLDYKNDVFLRLKVLIQSHNVLMARLFEHQNLLHHLLGLILIRKVLLVQRLDSAEALCQLVDSKVDLTEGSFAEDLANSVEVDGGHRWYTLLTEAKLDQFQ